MKRPLFPLSFAVVTAVVISVVLLSGASSPRIHAQVAGDRTAVQCGNGLLNGRYGYEIKGTLAGIGPVVLVGTINHQSFDGTYTGAMTASYNGQIVPFLRAPVEKGEQLLLVETLQRDRVYLDLQAGLRCGLYPFQDLRQAAPAGDLGKFLRYQCIERDIDPPHPH